MQFNGIVYTEMCFKSITFVTAGAVPVLLNYKHVFEY